MPTELITHIQHELNTLTGTTHTEKNMKRFRAYNSRRSRAGLPRLDEVSHICRLHGYTQALAAVIRMNGARNNDLS